MSILLEDIIEEIKDISESMSIRGERGPRGRDGIDGLDGRDGKDGECGEKGEKGDKGDRGEQGEQGLEGLKGEKGDRGEKGTDGKNGKDGKDGINGVDGKTIVKKVISGGWNAVIDPPSKQKGDMLVYNGSSWVRLPVAATDGLSLVSDSTTETGVRWSQVGDVVISELQLENGDARLLEDGSKRLLG